MKKLGFSEVVSAPHLLSGDEIYTQVVLLQNKRPLRYPELPPSTQAELGLMEGSGRRVPGERGGQLVPTCHHHGVLNWVFMRGRGSSITTPLGWVPSDQGGGVVKQPGSSGVMEETVREPLPELHFNDAFRRLMATTRWGSLLPFHS